MSQLDAAVEVIRDRGTEAVEAIQHGVEAIGTKLGVIEPPARRRFWPWMVVALVLVVVGVAFMAKRRAKVTPTFERTDRSSSDSFASSRR